MKVTEDYDYLWNGSEPGWVVARRVESRVGVEVLFSDRGPTIAEVKAIRTVVPALLPESAGAVLAILKGQSNFALGEFEAEAAQGLLKQCESAGLRVVSDFHSVVCYSIINEMTKVYLLIEDDAMREVISKEAIKRGLPIRDEERNAHNKSL